MLVMLTHAVLHMLYRYALDADGNLNLRDIRDELLKRGSLQVRASAVIYSFPEHEC